MLKVNIRNTRTRCEICSKLIMKAPERRFKRHSGVFIVNFGHILPCSIVSIVNFEQVNTPLSLKAFLTSSKHFIVDFKMLLSVTLSVLFYLITAIGVYRTFSTRFHQSYYSKNLLVFEKLAAHGFGFTSVLPFVYSML